MNARAIIEQIKALPKDEQAEVFEMVHRLEDDAIPESFSGDEGQGFSATIGIC